MPPRVAKRRAPDPPTTPLAKRSKNMLAELSEACCVRCAQYILGEDQAPCNKTDEKKCTYCHTLHKPCVDIPAKFWTEINEFFTIRDSADAVTQQQVDDLDALNKRMRAHMMKDNRFGGPSKPKSTVDAVVVLVKEMRQIKEVLIGIMDSYRSVNGLPPLATVAESDEGEV